MLNFLRSQIHPARNLVDGRTHIEHILGGVVMHFADFVDVIVQGRHSGFFFRKRRLCLIQRPSEVVAVIFH